MGPLQNNQKESIIRRIHFIRTELTDLGQFRKISYQEYQTNRIKRRNVERIEENVLNALIDIGKIVLSGENIPIPNTYKDIFVQLALNKIIDKKTGDGLSQLMRVRNILSHQYLDLSWDYIKHFFKEENRSIKKFLKKIEKYL